MRAQWFRLAFPMLALFSGAAFSDDALPAQFTLGRYVPADSWMYLHGVDNSECHWVEERWAEIFQGLVDSGVADDIKKMVFSLIPAEHRNSARAGLDRMVELMGTVKWRDLASAEFVFARRSSSTGLGNDYLGLLRGKADTSEHNFKSLRAIAQEIAGLSDQIVIQDSKRGPVHLFTIGERGEDGKTEPSLWVWRAGDIIGVALAPTDSHQDAAMVDDVLALMSGGKEIRAIVDAPRFRKALAHVQRPADLISFYDIKMLVGNMRGAFREIGKHAGHHDETERAGVRATSRFIDLVDVIDYSITSETTRGDRSLADRYTCYQRDKRDQAFARMFLKRKPFEKFDRFVPKNATSFSLSTSIDFEVLYDLAIAFVREDLPGGDQIVARLDGLYEQFGFDPKRDLFSWWSGETIRVSMPAAVVTPMGGGSDWTMMIRVKDPEIASCRVNGAIDWASNLLQQRGHMLMVSPAKCGQGGFRKVTHPMAAMFFRPVIGVQDDWLVVANSAGTVKNCVAVAQGKAPSIRQNKRFQKEGLIPDGPVHGLSFEDLRGRGDEWGSAAVFVGMIGGMAMGMLPSDTSKEARQFIRGTLDIVTKLAPLLQRINFYSSKATRTVMEGDSAFRCQTVVTYKRPASAGGVVSQAKRQGTMR